MKYIDADKLIAEIERQQRNLIVLSNTEQVDVRRDCALQNGVYAYILDLVASLQHEQPEVELSEFEKRIRFTIDEVVDGRYNADNIDDVKGLAKGLLVLARDQFIKDGYVIEKKAFKDAVGKVAPEVMKEVSDKVDMEEALRLGYEKGRADALKDLPRWKKWENGAAGNSDGHPIALVSGAGGIRFVSTLGITGEKYIMLADLKELPGFKEDEKWK